MDIQEETRNLGIKYLDAVFKLNNIDKTYSKEEHDNNDKNLINIITFLEELLGNRLELNYIDTYNGNIFTTDNGIFTTYDQIYTHYDRIFDYPRFDDEIVAKYIKKILENGINSASQEWLNSDYHKKAYKTYQSNSGEDSDYHNSSLRILSEIRRIKTYKRHNVNEDEIEETKQQLDFLYDALTDDFLINSFENYGLEQAARDYHDSMPF